MINILSKLRITFLMILVISLLPYLNAKFVCGEVSSFENVISPSWLNVNVFYTTSPDKRTTCDISPDGNKYCCDVDSINKVWKIGDEFSADIFDNSSGLFANNVSLISTGEGYDVFPLLNLKKAINIQSKKITFSESPEILLNITFEEPFTYIKINNQSICNNCTNISQIFNANFGMNNILIETINAQRKFSEDFEFAILEGFNSSRNLDCVTCETKKDKIDKGKINSNEEIIVNIDITLSNSVQNLVLVEYIPNDWDILDYDGYKNKYSETYNTLSWNFSGDHLSKNYSIRSPIVGNIPQNYKFYTELEGETLNEDEIKVSKINLLSFLPSLSNERSGGGGGGRIFPKVSPTTPAFIISDNIKLAAFPGKNEENVYFKIINSSEDSSWIYYFDTDMINITQIYLDLDLKKEDLRRKGLIKPEVLFNKGEWVKSDLNLVENEHSFIYRGYIPSVQGLAIVEGSEQKFVLSTLIRNIFEFFKHLFSFFN